MLVLPGFVADDQSTEPLRWFLRRQRYRVYGWHLGNNLGPTARVLAGLSDRLEQVFERNGRKVSLVGWSLGGFYARHLARLHPDNVRQVVTLGCGLRMREGDRSATQPLWDRLSYRFAGELRGIMSSEDEVGVPTHLPSTSIYSRTDGVVRWFTCLENEGPLRENIEVVGSHSGLGFNPAALYAVADRLAQPEGTWRPFRAGPLVSRVYPPPGAYRASSRPT